MKKNDLLTLMADGLGADLEGVCRADGMAVFVPGMLPGETARVRIVKVQSRFAFGRMEGKPLTASPARKTPDCAAYPPLRRLHGASYDLRNDAGSETPAGAGLLPPHRAY